MRSILRAVGAEEASLTTLLETQYKESGEYLSQHGKDGKPGEKAMHSLARLLAEYAEARSFRNLADRHGIHRLPFRQTKNRFQWLLLRTQAFSQTLQILWPHSYQSAPRTVNIGY
jgi:hypothetical protein